MSTCFFGGASCPSFGPSFLAVLVVCVKVTVPTLATMWAVDLMDPWTLEQKMNGSLRYAFSSHPLSVNSYCLTQKVKSDLTHNILSTVLCGRLSTTSSAATGAVDAARVVAKSPMVRDVLAQLHMRTLQVRERERRLGS